MQDSVATLLLVTAAVILTCVVVNYAITTIQETLNTENIPEFARLRDLQNEMLNQTTQLFNATQPLNPDQPAVP